MKYNGEIWSLTTLVKHLLNTKQSVTDPRYFKYKGEWLNDIRIRTEKKEEHTVRS